MNRLLKSGINRREEADRLRQSSPGTPCDERTSGAVAKQWKSQSVKILPFYSENIVT